MARSATNVEGCHGLPSPLAMKRIADEYVDAPNYRKRILHDYVFADPDTILCDLARVQTRGRSIGSTQQLQLLFDHVDASLGALVGLRRYRICQATVQNSRTRR